MFLYEIEFEWQQEVRIAIFQDESRHGGYVTNLSLARIVAPTKTLALEMLGRRVPSAVEVKSVKETTIHGIVHLSSNDFKHFDKLKEVRRSEPNGL
jgi:hypothetical protein